MPYLPCYIKIGYLCGYNVIKQLKLLKLFLKYISINKKLYYATCKSKQLIVWGCKSNMLIVSDFVGQISFLACEQ